MFAGAPPQKRRRLRTIRAVRAVRSVTGGDEYLVRFDDFNDSEYTNEWVPAALVDECLVQVDGPYLIPI